VCLLCVSVYTCVYLHVCLQVCVHAHVRVCVCVCKSVCIVQPLHRVVHNHHTTAVDPAAPLLEATSQNEINSF
jgi:hypothetical protein